MNGAEGSAALAGAGILIGLIGMAIFDLCGDDWSAKTKKVYRYSWASTVLFCIAPGFLRLVVAAYFN